MLRNLGQSTLMGLDSRRASLPGVTGRVTGVQRGAATCQDAPGGAGLEPTAAPLRARRSVLRYPGQSQTAGGRLLWRAGALTQRPEGCEGNVYKQRCLFRETGEGSHWGVSSSPHWTQVPGIVLQAIQTPRLLKSPTQPETSSPLHHTKEERRRIWVQTSVP